MAVVHGDPVDAVRLGEIPFGGELPAGTVDAILDLQAEVAGHTRSDQDHKSATIATATDHSSSLSVSELGNIELSDLLEFDVKIIGDHGDIP
jgi:hypothetical protein